MNAPLRHPCVALKERPFDGRVRMLPINWLSGQTVSIAEILASQSDLPLHFHERCVARLDGEIVPRAMWPHVRLKPLITRDVTVVFSLPLGNGGRGGGSGGGGSKNPLASVAEIAVLVAAAAVSGGALGFAGFGAGTVGASLAGAAIGIGGALAVAALAPPPTLKANQGVVSADNGTNEAASLSGNMIAKGGSVPRVLGTMRVFPPIITPPLIEVVGNDTIAECVYGLAGPHALSMIEVGTTPASSITELQTEIQEGLPNSPILGLVTRQSFTDTTIATIMSDYEVDLSTGGGGINLLNQTNPSLSCPQWEGMTTRIAPDEFWITISFTGGLQDTSGHNLFVPFRIRMRQAGTTSWINLPEFHVLRTSAAPFLFMAKLMWKATPPSRNVMPNSGGPVRAIVSVPQQNATPTGTGGWTADSYFYNGTGDTYLVSSNVTTTTGVINMDCFSDRVEFYLNGVKFPQGGAWEAQIIRGQSVNDNPFSISAYTLSPPGNVFDFFGYVTSGGIATRLDDARNVSESAEILRTASIWNQPPVPDPSAFAVIAAKVTNRSIDQLSVLASSYVNDWDGTGWNTFTTTSNPAPHLYDVLTGTLGGSPLPAAIIDSAGLVAFRTRCIAQGYTCNAVAEGKTYIDVAKLLAAAGYASLVHSELWGVSMDMDTSGNAPVQMFNPRNMSGFGGTKAFARLPTGIRAQFQDASNNYLQNEIIVFDDPNNPDSSRLEQITYDGLVNQSDVIARANYDLLQAKLRLTFYKGKADIESIVCQRGDLVGVQYDVVDSFAGFSRVQSVMRDGSGNITGFALDGSVPVTTGTDIALSPDLSTAADMADFGAQTGCAIRLKGGNGILTKAVTASQNGDNLDIAFVTPFADPGTSEIDVGCLCSVGRLTSEYRRLKVYSVQPSPDMTADLTFVDEAPELWA